MTGIRVTQRPVDEGHTVTERRSKWLVVATVWLSFLLTSLVSAPIPAVNEPHYLAKARHDWDPTWCANDLFLESFSAHRVFYQTFGWLTLWLDFATVAFVGRAISLALLAASWTSLVRRLQRDESSETTAANGSALLSAWLFLGLQGIGNLSGEWLIGGFESKVIAFAFVFWAIAAMLSRRVILAAVCSGVAISFHPIVGLWHLAALGIAELPKIKSHFNEWRRLLIAVGLLSVTSCFGLWPAIDMLRIAKPDETFAANFIQVFYRLKHHLDPMDFGVSHFIGYGLLLAVWLSAMTWLRRKQSLSASDRWWIGYVFAAALFAVGGLLAGWGPRPASLMPGFRWRMVLLKFYPFRLFDLLLPIAVVSALPKVVKPRWLWLVGASGLCWAMLAHHFFPPPNQLPSAMRNDWRDVCRWVSANTPADAVFHTPFEAEAFKWFAQRAEYVNLKDCPQDAAGIVEWNHRLKLITKWSEKSFLDDETYSADELRELVRQTNVRWAITRTRVPYEVPDSDLLYSNDTYKILRLPEIVPTNRR